MIFDNTQSKYSVLDLGFDKSLTKALLNLQGEITPEMMNVFSGGTAPRTLIAGELITALEQQAGAVFSGKTAFDNAQSGYRLGVDTDETAKFYIGDATNYFNWTGSTLNITGAITASSGTIGGWTIGATTITGGTVILDSSGIITGGTIRTSSLGKRVQLNSSNNRIEFFDTTSNVGYIDGVGGTVIINATENEGGVNLYFTNDVGGNFIGLAVDGAGVQVGSSLELVTNIIEPNTDNSYACGVVGLRWSDVRSVLINGADIGLENGWKFREYPATKEDIGKSVDWMKKNANLGIQILDENEILKAVIHKNGYIYCKGFRSLEELNF